MTTLKINIISLAGTNSCLAEYDLRFAKVIKEGLEKLCVDAKIEIADLSIARHQKNKVILDQIFPIYKEKGIGISPAYFLNDELISYGRVLSAEEFISSITDRFDIVDWEKTDA